MVLGPSLSRQPCKQAKGRRKREGWNSIERFTTVYEEARPCAWKWRKIWRYFQFRHRLPDMWKERQLFFVSLGGREEGVENGNCSFHCLRDTFPEKKRKRSDCWRRIIWKGKFLRFSFVISNLLQSKIESCVKIEFCLKIFGSLGYRRIRTFLKFRELKIPRIGKQKFKNWGSFEKFSRDWKTSGNRDFFFENEREKNSQQVPSQAPSKASIFEASSTSHISLFRKSRHGKRLKLIHEINYGRFIKWITWAHHYQSQ